MKFKGVIWITFPIMLALSSLLSACCNLPIGVEPAASNMEPIVSTAEIIHPTPTSTELETTAAHFAPPAPMQTSEPAATAAATATAAEDIKEETATGTVGDGIIEYNDEQKGISFSYPANWTMDEEPNSYEYRIGNIRLIIAYRKIGEMAAIWKRTGIPAGDIVELDESVPFLGQLLSKNALIYEEALKMVFYGARPVIPVNSEGREFILILEDYESDYLTVDIPIDIQAEAEAIVSSFAAAPLQGDPSSEILTYTNSEYGFSFQYPATWSVAEVNGEAFIAFRSRSVQLIRGTTKLVIGFRRAGEDFPIAGSGVPAGEFETRETVGVIDQEVPRVALVFEGKDKAVFYGEPGSHFSAGGLEFAPRLGIFSRAGYYDIELSDSEQSDADQIVSSLVILNGGNQEH